MKIKTNGKSLHQLSSVCDMSLLEKEYISLCETVKTSLKRYNPFHLPPSLRMFHYGEYNLKGDDLKRAVLLRDIWHEAWSFKNQVLQSEKVLEEDVVWLDSFETETVIKLKDYYRVKIDTF